MFKEKYQTQSEVSTLEMRVDRSDMHIIGLEQPIPGYYSSLLLLVPSSEQSDSLRFLIMVDVDDPDEPAELDDFMEMLRSHTGGISGGFQSQAMIRIERPEQQGGISGFRILNGRFDLDDFNRWIIKDILVSYGLKERS